MIVTWDYFNNVVYDVKSMQLKSSQFRKRHLWATEQYPRWSGGNGWFQCCLRLVSGPGVNDVKPSTEEEGEDLKEVHVSNRTVSKMNWWKWSVPMLLEIGRRSSVYDVKLSTQGEGEESKEACVCNKTENNMETGKGGLINILMSDFYRLGCQTLQRYI